MRWFDLDTHRLYNHSKIGLAMNTRIPRMIDDLSRLTRGPGTRSVTPSSVLFNALGTLLENQNVGTWKDSLLDRTRHARRAAKDLVDRHREALTVAKAVTLFASIPCGLAGSNEGMVVALGLCVATTIVEGVVNRLTPGPLDVPVIDASEHSLIVSLAQARTALVG